MTSEAQLFKNLPFFSSLSESEFDRVISLTKKSLFKKDEIIFREGDAGGAAYIVLSGNVRISVMVRDNIEKPLVTLRPGSMFGEVSLIDQNQREVRATAVEEVEALYLDGRSFDSLLNVAPELGNKILKVMVKTVVERNRSTTELYRQNIQWGLSVSGALNMNWHQLITDEVDIKLELTNNTTVAGKFLKVEQASNEYEFFIQTKDDKVFIVPYHSVVAISFHRQDTMKNKSTKEDS